MPLFRIADFVFIGVLDIDAASAWYIDKFGFQQVIPMGDGEDCISLAVSKQDLTSITLGPLDGATDGTTPMLYTSNVERAREKLISRGVNVGPLEEDRQGTHYFEVRDLDGNQIEVTEEP